MKIKKIGIINKRKKMIDISVKDKLFYISKNNKNFYLTHNSDPADVDIDLDSEIHKTVENYLKDKYGIQKVCHISNFTKFGPKTVVKDLCRIYELDYTLSNKLTSLFTADDELVSTALMRALHISKKINDNKLSEFINQNYNKLVEYGDKMVGMVRQIGKHASGILISNKDLNKSDIPVLRIKGETVTGVQEGAESREITELGYLKLDILGLTNASVINSTIKQVNSKYNLNLENYLLKGNFDDKRVWEEFSKGNCKDIFQFGGEGMINLILEIKPQNINELCAINSLYRPANIECISKNSLINTKNGKKNIIELKNSDEIEFLTDNNEIKSTKLFKKVKKTSKKKLYRITLDNGNIIEVSGKHRIKTINGYYKAKELNIDDFVIIKKD